MKKADELINWSSLPSGSSSLSCREINSLSSTVRSLIKVSKPPGEKQKEVNTKSLFFYVVFATHRFHCPIRSGAYYWKGNSWQS